MYEVKLLVYTQFIASDGTSLPFAEALNKGANRFHTHTLVRQKKKLRAARSCACLTGKSEIPNVLALLVQKYKY